LLEQEETFQKVHSLRTIAAVPLRLYDHALLLGDTRFTRSNLLFGLNELAQDKFSLHGNAPPQNAFKLLLDRGE
jgi:hypothetical protein